MVAKKRKSKRQTLQQKYKIIKRTKQHHKKLNKGGVKGTKKTKTTDDRIPTEWPFREQLLKEVHAAKQKVEEQRVIQKEKRKQEMVKWRYHDVYYSSSSDLLHF